MNFIPRFGRRVLRVSYPQRCIPQASRRHIGSGFLIGEIAIVCAMLSAGAPVWIRTFRLNKAVRILRRFNEILPCLQNLPPSAQHQFSHIVKDIEGCEEIISTKQEGLHGFIKDRGAQRVTQWYEQLQTDFRDMQLSLREIERSERSNLLEEIDANHEVSGKSQKVLTKLRDILNMSILRQTSEEHRLSQLDIISREVTIDSVANQVQSYMSILRVLEFLEANRYENQDQVLFGGATKEVRGKR